MCLGIFYYLVLTHLIIYLSLVTCSKDNNWAILIDTSAYWFNYRHASNILGVYSQIRSRGIPDSRIILMLAEDIACNSRNVFPGTLVNNELKRENLMDGDVEIDYRGPEVSVENLIRLLTNRHSDTVTTNKLLNSNKNSKIFIYLTGHGGENFMKFRNIEEVSAHDLAGAFDEMWLQGRYKEILLVIDTCQAASMFSKIKSPNIYGIASSKMGESSYSYTVDSEIGLSVIDRFSHKFFEFLKHSSPSSTLQDLINYVDPEFLASTPTYFGDLFPRPPDQIKIFDFLSDNPPVKLLELGKAEDMEIINELIHAEGNVNNLIINKNDLKSKSKQGFYYKIKYFDKIKKNCYYKYLSLIGIIGISSIIYYYQ